MNLLYRYSPLNTVATIFAACVNANGIPEKLRWPFILVQSTDRHANFIFVKPKKYRFHVGIIQYFKFTQMLKVFLEC